MHPPRAVQRFLEVLVFAGLLHSEYYDDESREHRHDDAQPDACKAIEVGCVLDHRGDPGKHGPDNRKNRKQPDLLCAQLVTIRGRHTHLSHQLSAVRRNRTKRNHNASYVKQSPPGLSMVGPTGLEPMTSTV
jgi:hypothetical protein